jgi:hypothetical protein
MKKGRLREALISIGIGLAISILTSVIELLKEVDLGNASHALSSGSGMLAYYLQKLNTDT